MCQQMNTFHSACQATEFVAARIVEEAQREAAPLSDLERRMLYVSAADAASDTAATCEQFDHNYDQDRYETKITRLLKMADRRFRTENPEEWGRWRAATRLISATDHYVAVMIVRANLRPRWDFLKLVATGIAVVCALMGVIVLLDKYNIETPSREAQGFYVWATLISLAIAYCLLRLVFGKDRFDDFIWNLSARAFRRVRKGN
jgi:hypothetical protein